MNIPVIDSHIHLFDPNRPQGVPWPPKSNTLIYKPTYPDRYKELVKAHGVVGAIEVECSPWLEDNQWVLDVAKNSPIIVGMIGNLEPDKPDFLKQLDRFGANPLFRGIRYGYLWDRDLRARMADPKFMANLRVLGDRGYTLDAANPMTRLLEDIATIAERTPKLKIVIDHLPKIAVGDDDASRKAYDAVIARLVKQPQVYVKVSAVLGKIGDKIPYTLAPYKKKIDGIYDAFGPDRLLYGSDWPNSEPSGNYTQVITVVREYFEGKGKDVAEKYFWKNSVKAYGWKKRDSSQPG